MSVKFMVFTDLHYDEMGDGAKRLDELVRAIEKNNPDFCICLGDFCEPIDDNLHLKSNIEGTGVPIYFAVGNHELDHHSIDEVQTFMRLEKTYYSFEVQEYKFIVLNTCYWNKDGVDYPYYRRNYKEQGAVFQVVPQDELEWLEAELQDNKKYIIFSHHSFINEFANRGVNNRQQVREILKNKNVLLCMNGHDHGDAMKMEDDTVFYTVNSASYMWAGSQIASSEELTRKYAYLHGILPYKQVLYAMVEIDETTIRIQGIDGEYLSVTPYDIGLHDYKWNGVLVLPRTSTYVIKY